MADGVQITDSAFGGVGTFSRGGRHENLPATKTDQAEEVKDTHEAVFGSVYVNAIAHPIFVAERWTRFPEGSVIVREKLVNDPNGSTPELLTVMVKRGEGFNPAGGDWEYMVLNGAGTTIRERGRLESCQSCHARQKEADFVFRAYLMEQKELKEH